MCGIAGIIHIARQPLAIEKRELRAMSRLIAHRGPDGEGQWLDGQGYVGLVHRRLSIIDLTPQAAQPMLASNGSVIVYNGEIYNYLELLEQLGTGWSFRSHSDTECILAAYDRYGQECLDHLRGMFAFALWDPAGQRLFCARDRFGIKPFYYAVVAGRFHFASEVKALLPFLPDVATDAQALAEYLTFQYTIGEQTLFQGVQQLLLGHALMVVDGEILIWRYWDVHYQIDLDHSSIYFQRRLTELMDESMRLHLRADVPVGSYLSGGIDSSLITMLASRLHSGERQLAFHGKFTCHPGYDESDYARTVAALAGNDFYEIDMKADDFRRHIRDVIYHLDYPVAGPGSFPQYMVSKLVGQHLKVVLGGGRAGMKSSAAMPAIFWPISSRASRRPSTGLTRTATSW